MPPSRSLLDLWLALVTAALLLFSGMPKLECCCVGGGEQTGSCCSSRSSEKQGPSFGGCGCDPAGDCDCDHDLEGPPDLPPEDSRIARDFHVTTAVELPAPERIAPPGAIAVHVERREEARASPPPLFLVHCVFRC